MQNPAARLPSRPFTVAHADAHGVSRKSLRTMLEHGVVRRVLRGVYARADVPDSIELRAAAAALVLPPFGVVTDRSAAWLHGVDALRYKELEVLPALEVRALRGCTRTRRDKVAGGTRDLDPVDVMTLAPGVRVTTPLRTALDLGCTLPAPAALAAIDGLMRVHGLETADLIAEEPRYWGRRGVRQLRRLIMIADPGSESPGESWTRYWMHAELLPPPVVQYSVIVDGVERYRLDLAYPHHRVCVEYDGIEHHSSPEDRAHDEARRQWLRDQGWTVIVVRADDVRDRERIQVWTRAVKDALASA